MSTLRQSRMPLAGSVLTGLVGQAFLIVSGVLAARILGVEDRGYLALLVLFPAVLAQIGSLGLPLAATFELSRDRSRWAEVIRRATRTLPRPRNGRFRAASRSATQRWRPVTSTTPSRSIRAV